jgi:[amino-group carrier protein]-gamma-(L-lysyl/L-ornithyl)-L-glutamate aminotransferase
VTEPLEVAFDPAAIEERHASGGVKRRPVTIVRAEGSRLFDADGKSYVDCAAAHGWAAVGHGHPAITEAIRAQAGTLVMHTESASNDTRARWFAALADFLRGDFPPDDRGALVRIQPANSGAEAIEAALKFARYQTGRTEFVSFARGFHGRTFGALSATASGARRETFAPLVPGFVHVPYDDLAAVQRAVDDRTAGVIVEIIQGEGGVHEASAEFLQGLQRCCRERGALLVVDEIQTGFCRTGRRFASAWHELAPDIVVLGKALGGGIPMSAAVWREGMGTFESGLHGSTFAGAPLACAASLATMEVLEREHLAERAGRLGTALLAELRSFDLPMVRAVRGRGLMVGIELKQKVGPILAQLMDCGVWALPAGMNVLRLLPPLTIPEDDLAFALGSIREALTS